MPTKQITRATLAEHVMLTLSIEPEEARIEGNASAISPEEDAETYDWIRGQLRRGNDWAWCCVTLTATYDDLTSGDSIGCCSYEDEAAFRHGPYYSDMVSNVLDALWAQLWAQLEARTPAGRARSMASSSRQAITTSYRPVGPKIIARCESKRITVQWDDSLDFAGNHAAAALQLMDQLGWSERNDLVMGGTRDGYVFVQVPKR